MAEEVNEIRNLSDSLKRLKQNLSLPSKCCCRYQLMTGIKWIFGLRFGLLLLILLVGLSRDFGLFLGIDTNPHRANATVVVNGTVVQDGEDVYQDGDTISVFPLVTCLVFLVMELVLWFGVQKKSSKALMAWLIYAGILVLAAIPLLLSALGQGVDVALVPLFIFIPHVYSMLIVCSVRNLILQGKWPETADSDPDEEAKGEGDEEQGKPEEEGLTGQQASGGGQPPGNDLADMKQEEVRKAVEAQAVPTAPSQPAPATSSVGYVYQPMASRQPIPTGYVYQPMAPKGGQLAGGYVPPSDLSRLGQQVELQARFAQPTAPVGNPAVNYANNDVPDLPPPSYEESK